MLWHVLVFKRTSLARVAEHGEYVNKVVGVQVGVENILEGVIALIVEPRGCSVRVVSSVNEVS